MKLTVVRYKTQPEKADENQRLIEAVFQELRAAARQDVRYVALRLSDSSFVHFSITDTEDGSSPIPRLAAFKSFQAGIKDRCAESPQQTDARIVGDYRMTGTS
jgi:hypothetical protein